MYRYGWKAAGLVAVVVTALLLAPAPSWAQRSHGGGFHGGSFHGGGFHGGSYGHAVYHSPAYAGHYVHPGYGHVSRYGYGYDHDWNHRGYSPWGLGWGAGWGAYPAYGSYGASPGAYGYYGAYPGAYDYGTYAPSSVEVEVNPPAAPPAYDDYSSSTAEEPAYTPDTATEVRSAAPASVTVEVPVADAQLWFNGALTTQTGTTRTFQSPPLREGQDYTYQVRVVWSQEGQSFDQTRTVHVQAGQQVLVSFAPTASPATETPAP